MSLATSELNRPHSARQQDLSCQKQPCDSQRNAVRFISHPRKLRLRAAAPIFKTIRGIPVNGPSKTKRDSPHPVRDIYERLCLYFAVLILLCGGAPRGLGAIPLSGTFYWTSFGGSNAYGYGSFSWDGVSLSATTTQLAPLPGLTVDGSLVVGSDGNIYSGRAGGMSKIDPSTGAVVTFSTGVNNNITSIDPPRTTIYSGWKDTSLATQTVANFGPGTPHGITGSDTVATGLAWQNNGTVWYTTGGENVLGNVGTINLSTFVTVRKLTAISATSIIFDPVTGHLFTAGINGIVQIDPATNTVVSTWANPQGGGSTHIQNLAVTGTGHLIALDDNGLLRIWDLSSGSHLIGSPDTIQASFQTTVISGRIALATLPLFTLTTTPL